MMVARDRNSKMSSTYQSFADVGPTYSYLDLSRARSDESLLWSAGEEAAVIVAELRASLTPHEGVTGDHEERPVPLRSHSFTDLTSASVEDLRTLCHQRTKLGGQVTCPPGAVCHCGGGRSVPDSALRRARVEGSLPPVTQGSRHKVNSSGGSWKCLFKMGGMSSRNKNALSAKKVSPPTVPDGGGSCSSSSSSSTCSSHRHSGSSLSSGVYSGDQRSSYSSSVGDESNPPPSPRSPGREPDCDPPSAGGLTCNGTANSAASAASGPAANTNRISANGSLGSASPSHFQNGQQFTFPPGHQVTQYSHLMCTKVSPGSPHHLASDGPYAYLTYQQQTSLEDQGIDVQSPGRSSPGSGSGSSTTGSTASSGNCRNSTTSLDSGRASSSTHTHTHRLSGHSYDSNSILRHSYHSSSSSLGSMEQDGTPHVNIHELIKNGVPDAEVLRAWLCDLHFEEYYDKFISAGYDMPTISRMTPEDLNAIGITKPAHRKKLKAEITRLNISDGLPDFIPSRLEEWLSLLRLEEYTPCLKHQNYNTVHQMTQVTWEDLEDVGISKLGHQKKVMLAIKRAKDIMSGKKFSQDGKQNPVIQYPPQEIVIGRESSENRETYSNLTDLRTFNVPSQYGHEQNNRLSGPDPGGQHVHYPPHTMPFQNPNHSGQYLPLHPSQYRYPATLAAQEKVHQPHPVPPPGPPNTIHYRPDVVAVQVRPANGTRGENPIYGTYHTFLPDQRFPPQGPLSLGPLNQRSVLQASQNGPHPQPQRSLDDGDITPTNEIASGYEGGATLPRPRTANKYRPVAKVTAKTRADVHAVPIFAKDNGSSTDNLKTGAAPAQHIIAPSGSSSANNTPQGTPKKLPPPPPKRSNSISESTKDASRESQYGYLRRGLSYGYMGVKSNLQPDVTPDLPPPPPAPQDSGNHQHLPEDFPPPPPPLTCITMANTARSASINPSISTSSGASDPLVTQSPHHHSLCSDSESEVGFRPRRNESNSSFKSTSSNDSSESLPFANDNAGTIKQRIARPPHTAFALMDARSPRGSPLSSPALRRKEGIVLPNLRQPAPHPPPVNGSVPEKSVNGTACISSAIDTSSPEETKDVLNDIGNMLANLTDELDAMLEQELAVKN